MWKSTYNVAHRHPKYLKQANEPALLFLYSWSWLLSNRNLDCSCSALYGNLHPSAMKLEFDPKCLIYLPTNLVPGH